MKLVENNDKIFEIVWKEFVHVKKVRLIYRIILIYQ